MADEPSDLPEPEVPSPEWHRQTIILAAVFIEGGLAFLATFLGWLLQLRPVEQIHWTAEGALWGVVATIPMLAGFFALHTWPIGPLRRIRRFGEEVIRPLLAPCTTMDMFGISVLAGVGEELLFRGVLQGGCERWFGSPVAAVLISALGFGLLHAITLSYGFLAALLGAYLSFVWIETDNLLSAIVAHALYDFVALFWLLRGPGSQSLPPEASSEKEEAAGRPE